MLNCVILCGYQHCHHYFSVPLKFTISYYLLLLYAVVVIKPMIPFVGDRLEHEFNYMEHIATVHAMYGANHMEKEMAADAKDNARQSGSQKTEEPVPVHVTGEEYRHEPFAPDIKISFACFQISNIKDILHPVAAPPPKCC